MRSEINVGLWEEFTVEQCWLRFLEAPLEFGELGEGVGPVIYVGVWLWELLEEGLEAGEHATYEALGSLVSRSRGGLGKRRLAMGVELRKQYHVDCADGLVEHIIKTLSDLADERLNLNEILLTHHAHQQVWNRRQRTTA